MMQQTSLPQSSMDVLVLISAVILREGIALAWLTFTPLLFPDCVTAGYNRGLSRHTQVGDLWEILPTLRVQMAQWREMRKIAQVDN